MVAFRTFAVDRRENPKQLPIPPVLENLWCRFCTSASEWAGRGLFVPCRTVVKPRQLVVHNERRGGAALVAALRTAVASWPRESTKREKAEVVLEQSRRASQLQKLARL